MDKESNLADHGVRKYENEVGVFTSIDPLWEQYRGWSPYQYAGNNPIMALDWNGKEVVFRNLSANEVNIYNKLITRIESWGGNSKFLSSIIERANNKEGIINLFSIEENYNNEDRASYMVGTEFADENESPLMSINEKLGTEFRRTAGMTVNGKNNSKNKLTAMFRSSFRTDSDENALFLLDELMHAQDYYNETTEKQEHSFLYEELFNMLESNSLKVNSRVAEDIRRRHNENLQK